MELTHIDSEGKARMVDVSSKPNVLRRATAKATVRLLPATIRLIRDRGIAKGDVLSTAKIAGVQGAKRTSELIPLCHQVQLDLVDLDFAIYEERIEIQSLAVCRDRTGVEMEAITAASIAAVAIYDMCKAVDKSIVITDIRLLDKTKEALP